MLHHLSPEQFFLLANTAGCYTADEAIRYARLAREAGFNEFVKLEVIGDRETLLPDTDGLLTAARELVREGFKVLAYTNDDLVTALRLEDAGCAAVMPLASPIGSGLGLLNPYSIRTIKARLSVPVVVDAGVGTASDACLTMEQGVDGILMNTALAEAQDPVAMAWAMRRAVEAGPRGIPCRPHASARGGGAVESRARDAGVRECLCGERWRVRRAGGCSPRRPQGAGAGARGPTVRGGAGPSGEGFAGEDRRLAHEMAAGVLRQAGCARCPARGRWYRAGWTPCAPVLRDVLRLGAFQLTSLDRVPAYAAVDTSVTLAKESGGDRAGGIRQRRPAATRRCAGRAPEPAGSTARAPRRRSTPIRSGWWSAGCEVRRGRHGATAPLERQPSPPGPAAGAEPLEALERRWREAGIAVVRLPYDAGLTTERRRPQDLPGYDEGGIRRAGPRAGAPRPLRRPPAGRDAVRRERGPGRQDHRAGPLGSAGRGR